MAFPDSNWSCVGVLSMTSTSAKKKQVTWDIAESFTNFGSEKYGRKSENFSLAGASWNFFISQYNPANRQCRFGINVHTSNAQFDSYCSISFLTEDDFTVKNIRFNFNCEKADTHWVANQLLSDSEFLNCKKIICQINIQKSSYKRKRTCSLNEDETIPNGQFLFKLGQDLKQLFESGAYSDVTFQVGGRQFKAHRAILDARSSVFAAMFRHDMKEKATGIVNVKDCDPSSFPVFLEFLYSGSTEKLSVENIFSIYKSADKYSVQDLKMECIEFVKENLSVENFCEVFEHLSKLLISQHLESDFLEVITDFFVGNCKKITLTAKWQALLLEYPIQVNEILIKALTSVVQDH